MLQGCFIPVKYDAASVRHFPWDQGVPSAHLLTLNCMAELLLKAFTQPGQPFGSLTSTRLPVLTSIEELDILEASASLLNPTGAGVYGGAARQAVA